MSVSSSTRYASAAFAAGDLDEPLRVRRGLGAGDEHDVGLARDRAHGVLAVRGGVADVVRCRTTQRREALAQPVDDLVGLVDRERRLRQVRDALGVRRLDAVGLPRRPRRAGSAGRLAGRPLDLLVAVVADQEDRLALGRKAARLGVHLRDERAGGVDHVEPACRRVGADGRRDAVRGEHDGRAVGHLVELLDEDGAATLEVGDHVLVVDDLLADVDRARRAARAPARRCRSRGRRRRRTSAARRAAASSGRRRAPTRRGRPLTPAKAAQGARAVDRHPRVGERAARRRRRRRGRRRAAGRRRRLRARPTPCRRRAPTRRDPRGSAGPRIRLVEASGPTWTRRPAAPERSDEERAPGNRRPGAVVVDSSVAQRTSPARERRVDAGAEAGDGERRAPRGRAPGRPRCAPGRAPSRSG